MNGGHGGVGERYDESINIFYQDACLLSTRTIVIARTSGIFVSIVRTQERARPVLPNNKGCNHHQ
jgi:hypothetical protein